MKRLSKILMFVMGISLGSFMLTGCNKGGLTESSTATSTNSPKSTQATPDSENTADSHKWQLLEAEVIEDEDILKISDHEDMSIYSTYLKYEDDKYGKLNRAIEDSYDEQKEYLKTVIQSELPMTSEDDRSFLMLISEPKQVRSDNRIVSYFYKTSYSRSYENHSHNNYYTFDTAKADKLQLTDILDKDRLTEIALKELDNQIGSATAEYKYADSLAIAAIDNETFTLGYESLNLYLGQDEDMIILNIPFAKYPDLLDKRYTDVGDNYAYSISTKYSNYLDLDLDGNYERIHVSPHLAAGIEEEAPYYTGYTVHINDKAYDFDRLDFADMIFVDSIYVIRHKSKSYILLEQNIHNYVKSYLMQWDGSMLNELDSIGFSPDENSTMFSSEEFKLSGYIDSLGNLWASDMYTISDEDEFKSINNKLDLITAFEEVDNTAYITKLDMKADLIDVSDKVISKDVNIAEGTNLIPAYTDNASYADFYSEDKSKLYRFKLSVKYSNETFEDGQIYEQVNYYINDVLLDEAFDNILYIG